jgi:hypothetical protein
MQLYLPTPLKDGRCHRIQVACVNWAHARIPIAVVVLMMSFLGLMPI